MWQHSSTRPACVPDRRPVPADAGVAPSHFTAFAIMCPMLALHHSLLPRRLRPTEPPRGAPPTPCPPARPAGNMVVKDYCKRKPTGALCRYLPALQRIDNDGGGNDTAGLGGFIPAVQAAGNDPAFIAAQLDIHRTLYWAPTLVMAAQAGLKHPLTLGQMSVLCLPACLPRLPALTRPLCFRLHPPPGPAPPPRPTTTTLRPHHSLGRSRRPRGKRQPMHT